MVCEGAYTEPLYFEAMRDRLRLNTLEVKATKSVDPRTLVNMASEEDQREKRNGERFDSVYCVFDRNSHQQFEEASNTARARGFRLARSWPCFEFWLLLHFDFVRAPYARKGNLIPCDVCIRDLRKHLPQYSKGELQVAILRSARLNATLWEIQRWGCAMSMSTLAEPIFAVPAYRCARRLGVVGIICGVWAMASTAQPRPTSAEALESVERVWARFATGLSEASGLPYTADELRKLLPAAQTADVAWAQVYADMASVQLEGLTASELLNAVEMQVSFKIVADISMAEFGQPLQPKESGWAELNEALWTRYAADLAGAQHLREVAPDVGAEDLLWVLNARHFDRTMLEEGFSAEELWRMPAYQLARKLAVDGLVRAMVNCTRCADAAAPYYRTSCMVFGGQSEICEASFKIATHACEISRVACRANPVARRGYCGLLLEQCLCKATVSSANA